MLDAAEDTLREEGYAALTSRRVAERIGLKQRLVYYYFRSMDELIVATFRRLSVRELQRLTEALSSKHPLWAIWDLCIHTADTRLISEFIALANRSDALRAEVVTFIEESRRIQVSALDAAMIANSAEDTLPSVALAIFATSAALSLHREAALGVRTGHAEITAAIGGFIAKCDKKGG